VKLAGSQVVEQSARNQPRLRPAYEPPLPEKVAITIPAGIVQELAGMVLATVLTTE
jgi:hypothetical protein